MTEMITKFDGDHDFLSNFYVSPFTMAQQQHGHWWNSAEHAFQAAKATSVTDFTMIRNASTPYKAKQAGRRVKCRADWDQVKRRVMLDVLLAKFDFSAQLRERLIETTPAMLVEGNTWGDYYWGAVPGPIGRGTDLPCWAAGPEQPSYVLYGHNWLGQLLTVVRDVLGDG